MYILITGLVESRTKKIEFEKLLVLWEESQFYELIASTNEYFTNYGYDPTLRILQAFSNYYLGYDTLTVGEQINRENLWNAIRMLRQLVSLEDERIMWKQEVFYTLAKSYYLLGTYYYERAISSFENIDDYETYRDTLEYLTLIANEQKDYSKALLLIDTSLSQNYSLSLHLKKIEILLNAEMTRKAEAELLQVEKLLKQDDDSLVSSGKASDGDTTSVLSTRRLTMQLLWARANILNSNYAQAQDILEPLIERDLPVPQLYFYFGIILEASDNFEQARFYFRKAIALDPLFFLAKERLELNERKI